MAPSVTLYRFRMDLSDVDRDVYEQLDFRVAQHPSESLAYLFTRVLAFALNAQDYLEFSPQGLADPETPAIWVKSPTGNVDLWIEIGNPSPKKLNKATKTAKLVKIYTYKDPLALIKEASTETVFRAETVEITALPLKFLESLEAGLERDNKWGVLINDGSLSLSFGDHSFQCELKKHSFLDRN
jgi:uncharacterized protein YaeQ